ncbi:uncharacterized protein LOC141900858 [Tubulanus polymorphus]|uniref:uncharacterized protein LOC141900858 n=1 Tax=Tubulanus polymorphus TaxID=672921 RepID=UPI003DA26ACD
MKFNNNYYSNDDNYNNDNNRWRFRNPYGCNNEWPRPQNRWQPNRPNFRQNFADQIPRYPQPGWSRKQRRNFQRKFRDVPSQSFIDNTNSAGIQQRNNIPSLFTPNNDQNFPRSRIRPLLAMGPSLPPFGGEFNDRPFFRPDRQRQHNTKPSSHVPTRFPSLPAQFLSPVIKNMDDVSKVLTGSSLISPTKLTDNIEKNSPAEENNATSELSTVCQRLSVDKPSEEPEAEEPECDIKDEESKEKNDLPVTEDVKATENDDDDDDDDDNSKCKKCPKHNRRHSRSHERKRKKDRGNNRGHHLSRSDDNNRDNAAQSQEIGDNNISRDLIGKRDDLSECKQQQQQQQQQLFHFNYDNLVIDENVDTDVKMTDKDHSETVTPLEIPSNISDPVFEDRSIECAVEEELTGHITDDIIAYPTATVDSIVSSQTRVNSTDSSDCIERGVQPAPHSSDSIERGVQPAPHSNDVCKETNDCEISTRDKAIEISNKLLKSWKLSHVDPTDFKRRVSERDPRR